MLDLGSNRIFYGSPNLSFLKNSTNETEPLILRKMLTKQR